VYEAISYCSEGGAEQVGCTLWSVSLSRRASADISGLAAMVRAGRGPGTEGGGSMLRVKELQEQLERSQVH